MKIKEVAITIEDVAPVSLQESYDNTGFQIGDSNNTLRAALITFDVTEDIVDEAINKKCNLIISHHPLIFNGLKKITGKNYIERIIIKAIKNDIAIYAAHTNLDNVPVGVNYQLAKKIGLNDLKILSPKKGLIKKLVTFVPEKHIDTVRNAIFNAGAGNIGNYDNCSFNAEGKGTFKPGLSTNPFVGERNKLHFENEIRFETVFPSYLKNKVISALIKSHPYEEVAYDIYTLDNDNINIGAGMIGILENEISEKEFLLQLKSIIDIPVIKHTKFLEKKIKKVALCGGSGSFLLNDAIRAKADVFITGDLKYHQYFDTENKILMADIGHFESEKFSLDIFLDILTKKFPNFAFHLSEINSNPINYI